MRVVSLMMEDDEKSIWCPIVYEYLQEFCYVVVTRDQIFGRRYGVWNAHQKWNISYGE